MGPVGTRSLGPLTCSATIQFSLALRRLLALFQPNATILTEWATYLSERHIRVPGPCEY